MYQNPRFELKQNSKILIRDKKSKAYLVSAVFVALVFVMSLLVSNLSGLNRYMSNYVSEYADAYTEAMEIAEETQNFEAAADRLIEAMEEVTEWPEVSTVAIILSVAITVMLQIVNAGYDGYCMMATRGEEVSVKDLFNGFNYTGRIFFIVLIRGILVAIGLVLFIVPGIIMIYNYRMAIYVAFDHPDWGPIACLKESRYMMKGKKGEVFGLEISFFGWFMVSQAAASVTIPIVDIWIKPYMGFTMAQMYNKISGYVPQKDTETQESDRKEI